ncbi:unnamed protein product [Urochloa humidicola]
MDQPPTHPWAPHLQRGLYRLHNATSTACTAVVRASHPPVALPSPVAPADDDSATPTSSMHSSALAVSTPPPQQPVRRSVTHTQSSAIPLVRYVGLLATMTTIASPIPTNYRSGLADPNWRAATTGEYKALIDNNT